MASFNKVILMGNLTRDPESRVTAHELSICKFTMAVNRKFTRRDGEQVEEVCYVDVTAFARQAEVLSDHLQKGSPILVEGRLKLDQWEDKDTGQKRSKIGVVLESFSFVGTKEQGEQEAGQSQRSQGRAQPPPSRPSASPQPADEEIDEDVPF